MIMNYRQTLLNYLHFMVIGITGSEMDRRVKLDEWERDEII